MLLGHGSRDPLWQEPFHRLKAMLESMAPNMAVRLAYLEIIEPTLEKTVVALAEEGIAEAHIVPVFFGQGGHVRRDIPAHLERLSARFPEIQLYCSQAVGENDDVLNAIAAYCLAQTNHAPNQGLAKQ